MTDAAPKVTPPKAPTPETIEILHEHIPASAILAFLVVGIVVGVGVYYVLTHVMIEDADNA